MCQSMGMRVNLCCMDFRRSNHEDPYVRECPKTQGFENRYSYKARSFEVHVFNLKILEFLLRVWILKSDDSEIVDLINPRILNLRFRLKNLQFCNSGVSGFGDS